MSLPIFVGLLSRLFASSRPWSGMGVRRDCDGHVNAATRVARRGLLSNAHHKYPAAYLLFLWSSTTTHYLARRQPPQARHSSCRLALAPAPCKKWTCVQFQSLPPMPRLATRGQTSGRIRLLLVPLTVRRRGVLKRREGPTRRG